MKTTKKLILFVIGLTIASMIVIISCKNRYTGTGPGDKGIFETGQSEDNGGSANSGDTGPIPFAGSGGGLVLASGYVLPVNSLSQEEQEQDYDPDFNSTVLFANGKIPALTVTKNGVILAAAGTGESSDYIVVKRSSDMGKTWSQVNANYEGFNGMYTHPFFINCHNGDILMGVATTNNTCNETTLYRSSDGGVTWTKQTNICLTDVASSNTGSKDETNCFVSFGQGLTLRHGINANQNKLMFPYYYYGVNAEGTSIGKPGTFAAIMYSEDDGKTFTTKGYNGSYSSYEPDLVELSTGTVLLSMRPTNSAKRYWFNSDNWNNCYDNTDTIDAMHTDFTRYEFNGKPIKNKDNDNGDKYALLIYSSSSGDYGIKMTTNDFNDGKKGGTKYHVEKELVLGGAKSDGYPAITTLPDGTIATLTDEDNGVVFRRFNLYWLSDGLRNIDYATDLKYN